MSRDQFIDWGSRDSHLILNPKLPATQTRGLNLVVLPNLPAHVWLASSGSTSATALNIYGLSKTAFLISAESVNAHLRAKKTDIWLNVLPLFHVGGLSIFARCFLSRSRVVDRGSENWSAEKFHSWVNDCGATLTSLVPTQVFDLVKLARNAPRTLRAIVVGGAHLDSQFFAQARELGFNVLPSYGMTECCSQIATYPATHDEMGDEKTEVNTLGENSAKTTSDISPSLKLQVLPHVSLQQTEDGFIVVRSSALFTAKCLWRADESRVETLWRAGEWFTTHDTGQVITDSATLRQYIIPRGRANEHVKVSGELISLLQLNEIFARVVGNREVLVYVTAQPDSRRGSSIAVILSTHFFEQSSTWIEKFNSEVLPVAKIRTAYYVPEIPVTALGKVKVAELRAMLGL